MGNETKNKKKLTGELQKPGKNTVISSKSRKVSDEYIRNILSTFWEVVCKVIKVSYKLWRMS